jgi:selenide,water dikinase
MDFAREGIVTGASARNWNGYGSRVLLASWMGEAEKAVLTDPQTSGGLLVACAPAACEEVLGIFRSEGFERAAIIGEFVAGEPTVTVG